MGKTIGKVLKVAGAAALSVATLNPGFLALTAGTISSLSIAGSISLVTGSLLDPARAGASTDYQGRVLQFGTSSIASRRILYGMAATGGTVVYREATGENNNNLHLIIALVGHRATSLDGFKFGKEVVNFSQAGAAIGKYSGFMNLSFHDGSDDQIADTGLVSASSKWSSNHRLSGISYAYIKLVWDHEIYPQGLEKTLFTLKGRRLYDPRKDPVNGGVGGHSLGDKNTWEWSDNPVLAMIDYLMGIRVGGRLISGMGISAARIDWANVIAEANICDERVVLKAGGDEPRYTLNGWVDPNKTHRDNLIALSSACGGSLVFQSGKWRCYVATQRSAVKSRCADDVVGPLTLQAKKSSSKKVNSVRGIYIDPNSDYERKDFPPIQSQTYIAEDGGNELWQDVNLPFTKSPPMAQRLAKIALGRARMEKVVKANFTLASIQDQAMDTIAFSHDRFNLNNQNMICADWRLAVSQTKSGSEGLVVECTLVEDSPDIYSWSSQLDEVLITQAEKIITPDRLYLDHRKIPGAVDYTSQVDGNVFSDAGLGFGDTSIGFGTAGKPDMGASFGAKAGLNIYDESGGVRLDIDLLNDRLASSHVVGVGKLFATTLPEDGAEKTAGKSLSLLTDRTADYIAEAATRKWAGESGAELTTGKSLSLLTDRTADYIAEAATRKWAGESGAELTTGKSLGLLINRTADYIANVALKRWSTPRREMNVGSVRASNPISAADVGADATISIAAHTIFLGDGTGISFNSGSITGRAFASNYYIYAAISTLDSGAQTVTYQSTTTQEVIAQNDSYYFVGAVKTPTDGFVGSTPGDGGGGGDVPFL
jgi:hypothetical protein